MFRKLLNNQDRQALSPVGYCEPSQVVYRAFFHGDKFPDNGLAVRICLIQRGFYLDFRGESIYIINYETLENLLFVVFRDSVRLLTAYFR